MQRPIRTIVSTAVATIIATSAAHAGSFSLYTESSARAIGNYAAGIAAEAADASTGWYNPAGLALLHTQQAVMSGAGVFPSSKISGNTTYTTTGVPTPYVQSFTNMEGAKNGFVPAFHYAKPIGENATVGLSMTSPFGLATDWSRISPVRYAATYSELLTVNLSPELGAKVTEHFALGAGLDLQWAKVKFNSVLGAPAAMQAASVVPGIFPSRLDSYSANKGHSVGVGFHVGGMGMFNENHTRIGLNYQSTMKHKFHGYSRLVGSLASPNLVTVTPAAVLATNSSATFSSSTLYSNPIELPDVVTLSGYQDVNESWAVLGSVVYTGWHTLRTIQLNNVAAFSSGSGRVLANSTSTLYYDNAWRAALGLNYTVNPDIMLRVGGGYDQTPTNDANRDVRIADSDRWALSAGAHYQARPNIGIDVGYTHLFSTGNVPINKTAVIGSSTFNVNASAKGSADLVGLQAVWLMDDVVVPVDTK